MVWKCLNDSAPESLSELIKVKKCERNTRESSNNVNELVVPFVKKSSFAARSFSVYGPGVWNKLPPHIKMYTNYTSFKRLLKTFLFKRAFSQA